MKLAITSEWVKLRTNRTLFSLLFGYIAVMIGVSFLLVQTTSPERLNRPDFDPIERGLSAVPIGLTFLVVIAVLLVTHEYSTGTIRSSLLAVPNRLRFYSAKIGMISIVTALLAVVAVIPGFIIVQAVLGDAEAPWTMGTFGHVAGAVAYTVLMVAFSTGVAFVLKSTAATLALLLPWFFTISTILSNIEPIARYTQFLPDIAGGLVLATDPGNGILNAWTGLGVLFAWTVLVLVWGCQSAKRRDV